MSHLIDKLDQGSVKLRCLACSARLASLFSVQQGPIVLFGCPHCGVCLSVQAMSGKLVDDVPTTLGGEACMDVPLSRHEMQLLYRALLRDDELMDELKSEPLAKLRNALEAWSKLE